MEKNKASSLFAVRDDTLADLLPHHHQEWTPEEFNSLQDLVRLIEDGQLDRLLAQIPDNYNTGELFNLIYSENLEPYILNLYIAEALWKNALAESNDILEALNKVVFFLNFFTLAEEQKSTDKQQLAKLNNNELSEQKNVIKNSDKQKNEKIENNSNNNLIVFDRDSKFTISNSLAGEKQLERVDVTKVINPEIQAGIWTIAIAFIILAGKSKLFNLELKAFILLLIGGASWLYYPYLQIPRARQTIIDSSQNIKPALVLEKETKFSTIVPRRSNINVSDRADALLSEASEASENIESSLIRVTTLSSIAASYARVDRTDKAIILFSEALDLTETIKSKLGRAIALKAVVSEMSASERSPKITSMRSRAISIVEPLDDSFLKAFILNNIASNYVQLGKTERANLIISKALATADKLEASLYKVQALSQISSIYSQLAQTKQANLVLSNALTVADSLEQDYLNTNPRFRNPLPEYNALTTVARGYDRLNQPKQATPLIDRALALLGDNFYFGMASIIRVAVPVYSKLDRTDKATALLSKALSYVETGRDDEDYLIPVDRRAYIFQVIVSTLGEIDEPLLSDRMLSKALATAESLEYPFEKGYALNAIAETYYQLDRTEKATQILSQALTAAETIEDSYHKAYALSIIAANYAQLGQIDRADILLSKALDSAKSIEDSLFQAYAIRSIAAAVGEFK